VEEFWRAGVNPLIKEIIRTINSSVFGISCLLLCSDAHDVKSELQSPPPAVVGLVRSSRASCLSTPVEDLPGTVRLHAAAIEWQGRTLLIPARSRAGKSTLTAAMVRLGATCISDDSVYVLPSGGVFALPRPIRLRTRFRGTRRLAGGKPDSRIRLSTLIIFTEHRPGAVFSPRRVSQATGVAALLSHTPLARADPGGAMASLTRCAEHAVFVTGLRGPASTCASHLLRMTGRCHA
jgi:hypothetical protein